MDTALRKLGSSGQVLVNSGSVPPRPVSLMPKKKLSVEDQSFAEFPFLYDFARMADTRDKFLDEEGQMQRCCPKSTSGWYRTLFVVKGRALDRVILPWIVVTLHAVIYSLLDELNVLNHRDLTSEWQPIFTFSLNTTLGFLLVFRLNRAAERYWQARMFWGQIVLYTRTLVSGLLVHASHAPIIRDEALRWLAAFPLTAKDFIRGEVKFHPDCYAGILSTEEILELEQNSHAPLYAAYQVRRHIKALFCVTEDTNPGVAFSRTQHMNLMESQINRLMEAQASMERIKGTPLPLVDVTHLRTFILINLFLLPWIWGPSWGWYTVPIVAVVGFALLGIEASCKRKKTNIVAFSETVFLLTFLFGFDAEQRPKSKYPFGKTV